MKISRFFGLITLVFFLFSSVVSQVPGGANIPERGFISLEKAKSWEEGLISGNGVIGINALSDPVNETVIFTHERLFMPKGLPTVPPDNSHMLFEIRDLIDKGLYRQATELQFELSGQESFMYPDPFVPAFDLNIRMTKQGEVKNYYRTTNFETGEISVHWEDDNGAYERKMFVSRPDGVAVLLITGPKADVSCKLSIDPRKPGGSLDINTISRSYRVFSDNITDIEQDASGNIIKFSNSFTRAYPGSIQKVEGLANIIHFGGKLVSDGRTIEVVDANKVMAIIDLDVLYNPAKSHFAAMKSGTASLGNDYDELLNKHSKVHGELFNRMKFEIGGGKDHKLPAEVLLESSTNENINLALLEKEFDAARYNIISCIGELPPTLQGVWGGTYVPGWASDFTHNGNVPSAIASLLMGNMPELMLAYTSYMESVRPYMRINARHIFGARGLILPSRSTTNAYNNALAPRFAGGFWVGGAAWAAHFFYDYYLYTGDKDYLAEHALPFMQEALLFFEDYLYVGDDGNYVFSPTQSPENTPGNTDSQGSFNATMDVAVAKELIKNTIEASKTLGLNSDKIQYWESMLDKMPDYMINDEGIIKEWLTPALENNDDHRHSSQLYPLYDDYPAEIANNPDLQEAFKKSIEYKLERHWRGKRSGFMSFGLVQLGQAAASLGESELAYECIQHLTNRFWLNNLASMHNHKSLFNMDISGGMPAVIIKMLVFSKPGYIELLPALPAEWPEGKIEGVLCRGQVEIHELSWDGNEIHIKLESSCEQKLNLKAPENIRDIKLLDGQASIEDGIDEYSRYIHVPENEIIELIISI